MIKAECLLVSMSWLIPHNALIKNENTLVKYERLESESGDISRYLLLVLNVDYLQQRPAGAGSPCSSPPHPAGRPPHSLCYPATTVAGTEGGGEGGGRGGNKPGGRGGRRGRWCVTLRLGKRKNCWKPPHLEIVLTHSYLHLLISFLLLPELRKEVSVSIPLL